MSRPIHPRRAPDAASPEVRAALLALGRAELPVGDVVVWTGELAAAVGLGSTPTLLRHGARPLVDEAREAGVPVLDAPELAAALAGVPTGDPLPATLALTLRARLEAHEPKIS
ncbi:MAG: hypothetical protein R3F60_07185 [bacterium]